MIRTRCHLKIDYTLSSCTWCGISAEESFRNFSHFDFGPTCAVALKGSIWPWVWTMTIHCASHTIIDYTSTGSRGNFDVVIDLTASCMAILMCCAPVMTSKTKRIDKHLCVATYKSAAEKSRNGSAGKKKSQFVAAEISHGSNHVSNNFVSTPDATQSNINPTNVGNAISCRWKNYEHNIRYDTSFSFRTNTFASERRNRMNLSRSPAGTSSTFSHSPAEALLTCGCRVAA